MMDIANLLEWLREEFIALLGVSIAVINSIYTYLSSSRNESRQRELLQLNAKWSEYKETAYDPFVRELSNLYKIGRSCRGLETSGIGEDEAKKLLGELMQQLEELGIMCVKIDSHPSTKERDWVRFAENEVQKIHNFIEKNDPLSPTANGESSLDQKIRDCIDAMDERLRVQREKMTLVDGR